jgi:ribose transport system permease protein
MISTKSSSKNKRAFNVGSIRELPAGLLLLFVLIWMFLTNHAFRLPANLIQLSEDAGILGIMACGEAFVILTGGIDLSVAAILALSSCAAGYTMTTYGIAWPLAAFIGLAVGALAGWLNGAMITYRRLPPILVTLATLLLFRSLTNVLTGAVPYNQLPAGFVYIGTGLIPFTVFVLVTLGCSLYLSRARYGRWTIAVGSSEQASRLSGIPTGRVLRLVYALAGLTAALAGLLMSAQSNNAQWTLADGWELDVIAAVVIGGVRLSGGEGSVIGAALGAMIIMALRNALFLNGIPSEQYGLITGGVILLAAAAEQIRRVRMQKARIS